VDLARVSCRFCCAGFVGNTYLLQGDKSLPGLGFELVDEAEVGQKKMQLLRIPLHRLFDFFLELQARCPHCLPRRHKNNCIEQRAKFIAGGLPLKPIVLKFEFGALRKSPRAVSETHAKAHQPLLSEPRFVHERLFPKEDVDIDRRIVEVHDMLGVHLTHCLKNLHGLKEEYDVCTLRDLEQGGLHILEFVEPALSLYKALHIFEELSAATWWTLWVKCTLLLAGRSLTWIVADHRN